MKRFHIKHMLYISMSFLGSFILIAHGIVLDFDLGAWSRITWPGVVLSTIAIYAMMVIYEKIHEYDD
ncbi:MAG: hypothetical protein A7315_07065 [Candidatus Altiarchaeales archaeon WOR_SM1_79]|nr:MAG: hypothetical protein A7315_07065 [Candidatus Altiarchaeales archaeon WOR_SM1_79]